jgi:type VI protein secretion system component VasK
VRSPTIRLLSVRRSLPLFLAIAVCLAIWQVWFTWRLMEQDRNLAAQHARERLEQIDRRPGGGAAFEHARRMGPRPA